MQTAEHHGRIRLSDVAPVRVNWLWRGYVPLGKLTLLDGDPGLGKSTLALDLAARGSIGGTTPTGDSLPTFSTIIVTVEDDAGDTIRPRLDLAGGDASHVHVVTDMSLPDDAPSLRRHVEQTGARLVIVDPIMGHLGGRVRTASDHEVRQALAPLAVIAVDLNCAVLALRHLSKEGDRSAIYRGGGSIGFAGLARSVLAVGRDPQERELFHLTSIKSNLAAPPSSLAYRLTADGPYEPARIEWDGESDYSAETLIGRGDQREPSKVDQLALALREIVEQAGGSMSATDATEALIAEGLDMRNRARITEAKKRAGIRSEKVGLIDGYWVWTLPESDAPGHMNGHAAVTA